MAALQRVAVLGGGISGLVAAWRLACLLPSTEVLVLEKSSKWGGWMQSATLEDGTVFELGPRSMRSKSQATLQLVVHSDDSPRRMHS